MFIEKVLEIYEYDGIHEMIFESVPRGYNIPAVFATVEQVSQIPDKTRITLFGFIDSFEIKPMNGRKSLSIVKAKLYKDGHSVNLQWTTVSAKARGMLYSLEMKSPKDTLIQVSGKVNSFTSNGHVYKFLEQPLLNTITETSEAQVLIPEPMYNLTEGIKVLEVQNAFRELIKGFGTIDKKDFLPIEIESRLGLQDLETSLRYLHGLKPIPINKFEEFLEYDKYKRRVLIEKIWRIMRDNVPSDDDIYIDFNEASTVPLIKELLAKLPFELTQDQKRAIWQLLLNFKKEKSKNLIFGDVGSGKTMVSLFIAYILYKLGYQVAILTPTSILAKQHFEEARALIGDNVFIVHSKTKKKEKDKLNAFLSTGAPAIVYGTSSINKLEFTNLHTIFIDEEQKFGVNDKDYLYKRHNAHIVFMTATPIPRTLANAMYTNFNIMKIEQKPAMQKPRITKIIDKIDDLEFIKSRLSAGEQALVIVPAISSNDLISSVHAEKKYGELFRGYRISTINGRMKPENIEKNTEDFMAGKFDILIATTMVDAGFSNKNLSFVFIENADRFGIAQLHQIRGRVGRAEKQGYCYLIPAGSINSMKEKTANRLNSLVASENGFELSMKDIEMRGSGDLRGTEQSGSEVNILDWLKEIEIINEYLYKGNT